MSKLRRRRIRELVRQFKENGLKMMLEHPGNVRDALGLVSVPWFDEIDFGRLMPLRLADSQLQIFRYQVRKWSQTHHSLARVCLFPVLPVVFYTGLRRWSQVGTLADLIERGEEFRSMTLTVERPLFVNLPDLPAAKLERDGGFFGWVLRLVQQRKSRAGEFQALLEHVVAHLEAMPLTERQRWRDLLSYIGAMIYHERSGSEQPKLHEALEHSVQSDELRQEVSAMGKTMADVLMEQGARNERKKIAVQTRQQTLVRLLRRRFGDVPTRVVDTVESTTDVDQLDDWLDRFATAATLDELEIPSSS